MRSPIAIVLSMLGACGAAPSTPVAAPVSAATSATASVAPNVDCEAPTDGQSIYGMITYKPTGDPLPGATVTIEGSQRSALTDMNGCYQLTMLPLLISWPGRFKIRINPPDTSTSITSMRTRTFGNMRFDVDVRSSAYADPAIKRCCP